MLYRAVETIEQDNSKRIDLFPAPEAEAKVAFVDWLAKQMPIGTMTIRTIRAYGLTAFANWCEEFNKRFAEAEGKKEDESGEEA